jgi:hypothetical protein
MVALANLFLCPNTSQHYGKHDLLSRTLALEGGSYLSSKLTIISSKAFDICLIFAIFYFPNNIFEIAFKSTQQACWEKIAENNM